MLFVAFNVVVLASDIIGLINRPLRRIILNGLRNAIQKTLSAKRSQSLQDLSSSVDLLLLVDRRASWEEFHAVLKGMGRYRSQLLLPSQIAYLFWINGRFDEVRDAVSFWLELSQERVMNDLKQFQTERERFLFQVKASNYRRAYIASRVMEVSKVNGDNGAKNFVSKLRTNKNPMYSLRSLEFSKEDAVKIGVSEYNFDKICEDAKKF